LVGGHTIRTTEPIFGLAVAGFVDPEHVWRKAGAVAGDALVLTKPLGTGMAVTAYRRGEISTEAFASVVAYMRQSSGPAARVVREFAPSAVTDITGLGLLGHALEMADAGGVQLAIELGSLPFIAGMRALAAKGIRTSAHDQNRELVRRFVEVTGEPDEEAIALALDPQTAGGLLVATAEHTAGELVRVLRAAGIGAARVGSVQRGSGITIRS
jgi:selenide,water dikinase